MLTRQGFDLCGLEKVHVECTIINIWAGKRDKTTFKQLDPILKLSPNSSLEAQKHTGNAGNTL